MKKVLVLFLISSPIVSCKFSNSSLGDNYWYLDIYEAQDVGYPGGAIIYRSPNRNVIDQVLIKGNVIDESHNDNYIIAKQIPINKKQNECFFIIDKIDDIVFGPLSKDSLKTLIKVKKIKLELKRKTEYNND